MKISFLDLTDWPLPNIALAYLIASLEKTNHKPMLIDCFLQKSKEEYILRKIKEQSPDIVGFSTMTSALERNLNIARAIKKEFPDLMTIFGGIHPTLLPEETLNNPCVDAICIGEGEKAIVELLDCLEEKKEVNVKGIWYKRDGQIINNELRMWEEDLDSLPFPAWDFWDIDLYLKMFPKPIGGIYVLASRGCPFECSFCSQKALKETLTTNNLLYYRTRSANNIIAEIKLNIEKYKDRGLKTFLFADDTFGLNRTQYNEFTEIYTKEGIYKIYPWACQTRADIINEEWVQKAKKSGCFLVELGLENSKEEVRIKKYKKKITDEQFQKVVKWFKEAGIIYNFNILIGSFGETPADIWRNVQESYALDPLFLYISPYIPHPKIELRAQHGDSIIRETNLLGGLPRIETDVLSIKKLNYIVWQIRLIQIFRKFKIGFRFKKFTFIFDLLKYILNYKRQRQIGFLHPSVLIHMFDRKILDYYREKYRFEKSKVNY